MDFYLSETLQIEDYKGIHLLQDHIGTNYSKAWDDYDYIIKFQVYYVSSEGKRKLGNIRLLINGYENTSIFLKENSEELAPRVNKLTCALSPDKTVSLPLNIDYYNKLNKLLAESDVILTLSGLCDASYLYQDINQCRDWPGFSGSLLRDGSKSEAILRKGLQIALGRYTPPESFDVVLEDIAPTFEDVSFHFDSTRQLGKTNINLLIGENGVGKTFLLKHLSEIVTGVKSSPNKWPYFHKLIVIAYSPFESFYTENELLKKLDDKYKRESKRKSLSSQLNRRKLNINEYAYVGFRDEKDEFNLNWPRQHSVESLYKILDYDIENSWWDEDTRLDVLKSTLAKSISFDNIALKNEEGKLVLIEEVSKKTLKLLRETVDKSFGLYFVKDNKVVELSSGQRIYSYMLPAIVAEIEDESLLVIDEPELYLHPSLEVDLVNMLKYLLEETKSYAVIATHSSVIAREVEKKSVTILRRESKLTTCSKPNFETYGESLELIMGEVFDDFETVKPYQKTIDKLLSDGDNQESIVADLGETIGDEALSYALSKISDEHFEVEGE